MTSQAGTSQASVFLVIAAFFGVALLAAVLLLLVVVLRRRRATNAALVAGEFVPPRRYGSHARSAGSGAMSVPPEAAVAERLAAAAAPLPRSRLRRREPVPAIRIAEPMDIAHLSDIEAQGDQVFSRSGLGALPSPGLGRTLTRRSVVFVSGRPAIAYARVDEVDGMAHLDQLSVLPSVARRGIGKALVQAAIDWAIEQGYWAITLTTFTDSAWNDPVYAANGFVAFRDLTPGLVELRDWERAIGLDAMGARIVMRRALR